MSVSWPFERARTIRSSWSGWSARPIKADQTNYMVLSNHPEDKLVRVVIWLRQLHFAASPAWDRRFELAVPFS